MSDTLVGGNLRRILPAAGPRPPPNPKQPGARTKAVATACDTCRKRKAKCSGERPRCRRCVHRKIQCHYATEWGETNPQAIRRKLDTLQTKAAIDQEFIQLLRTLPQHDAQQAFEKLRSGTDLVTILNHARTGDPLFQVAVSPETKFRYEFPYRSEMPPSYIANNPYLNSIVYEATSLYSQAEQRESRLVSDITSDKYHSLYVMPFHAGQVVEPRLSDARPSRWTTICSDDMLMRDLLAVFFRCEYQFTSAFHKDLFLEDMTAIRYDFCSSLLVNVVLAYSCICYPGFHDRAEYWNPQTLTYRFIAEAKRLWEIEASEPRLTTIQAGILFSVFHNLSGLDEVGQAYRIQSVALARKMHLFDRRVEIRDNRLRQGMAFTAWTLFNWESLVAFSFLHPSLVPEPPTWRLPDPASDSLWFGEIWMKYPSNTHLLPSFFGQVFLARCHFRIIMAHFCQEAYSKDSKITLDIANRLLTSLEKWHLQLPKQLLPKTIVLPHQLQLHIYYHHLVLSIYEPLFSEHKDNEEIRYIIMDGRKYLNTLVRLYFLRHGFEAMDLFIVIPLMLIGFEAIDSITENEDHPDLETLRSTILLVAKGLYHQRRNHYLAEALFHVVRGRMRPQEMLLVGDNIEVDEGRTKSRDELAQTIKSHWPVSVVKKAEDLDAQILTNLVENYANLQVKDSRQASLSTSGASASGASEGF